MLPLSKEERKKRGEIWGEAVRVKEDTFGDIVKKKIKIDKMMFGGCVFGNFVFKFQKLQTKTSSQTCLIAFIVRN